jgi:hypothetical protein
MPWVDGCDGLARLGLDKLIIDEEASGLLVLAAVWGCKVNEEIRHVVLGSVELPRQTETGSRNWVQRSSAGKQCVRRKRSSCQGRVETGHIFGR